MAKASVSKTNTKKTSVSKTAKEPQSMADLLANYDKPLISLKRRQTVDGTVIQITPTEIIFDLGSKAEGIISGRELDSEIAKGLKAGDTIPVTILENESDNNYVLCSLKPVAETKRFSNLKDSIDTEETIEVRVIEERKGGYLVSYNNLRGFLPASQVALEFVGKPKELIGKNITVKVLEFDREMPRLIVSQKAVVSQEQRQTRQNLFANLKIGDEVTGKVVTVLPFGLVVDVQGVEGFVHISEIAWERVDNPQNYYHVGAPVTAAVVNIDEDEGKVLLSIKQLTESPWTDIEKKFSLNQVVTGTVTKPTTYGILVKLDDGIVGLLPKAKLGDDIDKYKEGSQVSCIIEAIDKDKKRINLGLAG